MCKNNEVFVLSIRLKIAVEEAEMEYSAKQKQVIIAVTFFMLERYITPNEE